MKIATRDIPQADNLKDVLAAVDAVGKGARTDQDIAQAIMKVPRQGRYYRRAAEILGFLHTITPNKSTLSVSGRKYLNSRGRNRNALLTKSVLDGHLFQRLIPFLQSKLPHGCSQSQLQTFLGNVTEPAGPTMMPRRANTVVAWLKEIDLLEVSDGKYLLKAPCNEIASIQNVSETEPLLPSTFDLAEYEQAKERSFSEGSVSRYIIDRVQVERARNAHRTLTNLVAKKIQSTGAIPRCNKLVDIAARVNGQSYIFEVKSTKKTNAHGQIRRGISQLYEYRYLQAVPDARLVLVIENPLADKLGWVLDYAIGDREIWMVWDGDRDNLYCPPSLKRELAFLVA